jgi:hypothetical protein
MRQGIHRSPEIEYRVFAMKPPLRLRLAIDHDPATHNRAIAAKPPCCRADHSRSNRPADASALLEIRSDGGGTLRSEKGVRRHRYAYLTGTSPPRDSR